MLNYPSGRKKIEKDHLLECIAYIFQSCCAEQYTPFLFLAANDCLVLSTTNTNHPCVFLKSCICIYIYMYYVLCSTMYNIKYIYIYDYVYAYLYIYI